MTALRDLLASEATFVVMARVAVLDGQTQHWDLADEGHVLVSCVTLQHATPIWALLSGGGFWRVPDVGTEVTLSFDNGDFEGDAYLVAPHGMAPTGLDGVTNLIIGPTEIRADGGTAASLALQASVTALENKLNDFISKHNLHTHVLALSAGTGTAAPTVTSETPIAASDGTEIVLGQ